MIIKYIHDGAWVVYLCSGKNEQDMRWTDFMKDYSDEENSKQERKKSRGQVGVTYPHCGYRDHYWKADIECCECKKSKYRQSLMSIAVMYGSQ